MFLAWSDQRLRRCCTHADQLRAASLGHAAAAEDLVCAIVRAQSLAVVLGLRSIRTIATGAGLTFSLEEAEMYARLLTADGKLRDIRPFTALSTHGDIQGLLIEEFRVGGRSILRIAS